MTKTARWPPWGLGSRRISRALALLALSLALCGGLAQDRVKFQRPIMMDSNGPSTDLFVLDSSGSLHKLHVVQNGLQEYGRFSLARDFKPADMAYASSGGQESLLIVGTESGRGVATSYSLDGKVLKKWRFPHVCSGIDFAPITHSAYIATSDSNEIYQVDLQGSEPKPVTRIDDATKLGPLAFDEANQEIYVADVASGRIYQYSMATKAAKVLVTGLSAPTALVFDPATSRLLIADPGRRGIFTVDPRSGKPVVAELAPGGLKSPYGVTVISQNRIAVADYGASSVVVFSNKGDLLFRFPSN